MRYAFNINSSELTYIPKDDGYMSLFEAIWKSAVFNDNKLYMKMLKMNSIDTITRTYGEVNSKVLDKILKRVDILPLIRERVYKECRMWNGQYHNTKDSQFDKLFNKVQIAVINKYEGEIQ